MGQQFCVGKISCYFCNHDAGKPEHASLDPDFIQNFIVVFFPSPNHIDENKMFLHCKIAWLLPNIHNKCTCLLVMIRSPEGHTVIQHAISRHLPQVVEALCERGVNKDTTDAEGNCPLWQALDSGQEDIAKTLVSAKVFNNICLRC